MIDNNPTYHQLKSLTLTNEEKSDAELLVNACNRFLYPEAEVAIMKSAFQNMEQKNGETMQKFISRIHEMGMRAYRNDKTIRDDVSCT